MSVPELFDRDFKYRLLTPNIERVISLQRIWKFGLLVPYLYKLLFRLSQRLQRVQYHRCLAAAVPLLLGLSQRLLHVPYQRFSCVDRTSSSIVFSGSGI